MEQVELTLKKGFESHFVGNMHLLASDLNWRRLQKQSWHSSPMFLHFPLRYPLRYATGIDIIVCLQFPLCRHVCEQVIGEWTRQKRQKCLIWVHLQASSTHRQPTLSQLIDKLDELRRFLVFQTQWQALAVDILGQQEFRLGNDNSGASASAFVCKVRSIIQNCPAAAETWRSFDRQALDTES